MTPGSRRTLLRALLACSLVLAACTDADRPTTAPSATGSAPASTDGSPAPATPPSSPRPTSGTSPQLDGIAVTLEPFATVPGGPLAMAAADDGTGRLFVAAQDGKIWLLAADGTVGTTPMVDLGPRLRSGGEQGLLGLATHPEFPADPRIFVNYTDKSGDTRIAQLKVDPANPDRFDPDTHQELLFVDQPFPNHNGGAVLFGPDGYLYLALGDGGSGGDPQGNGQNLDALLGKILRVEVGGPGATNFGTPIDNPFLDGQGAPEIFHYGLRNPWRMSFDRATGDLWIGDVGQGQWEEVDIAPAGTGGLNFGWNRMEGAHCYGADSCDEAGLTLPISEYGHDLGCTIIGGYVYRGQAYGFLAGAYLFADYCSGRIFAIDAGSNGLTAPVEVGSVAGNAAAWAEDVDGELYLLTLGGQVYRVVAAQR